MYFYFEVETRNGMSLAPVSIKRYTMFTYVIESIDICFGKNMNPYQP